MTDRSTPQDSRKGDERLRRQAEELRANLKRRKQKQRASDGRATVEPTPEEAICDTRPPPLEND